MSIVFSFPATLLSSRGVYEALIYISPLYCHTEIPEEAKPAAIKTMLVIKKYRDT